MRFRLRRFTATPGPADVVVLEVVGRPDAGTMPAGVRLLLDGDGGRVALAPVATRAEPDAWTATFAASPEHLGDAESFGLDLGRIVVDLPVPDPAQGSEGLVGLLRELNRARHDADQARAAAAAALAAQEQAAASAEAQLAQEREQAAAAAAEREAAHDQALASAHEQAAAEEAARARELDLLRAELAAAGDDQARVRSELAGSQEELARLTAQREQHEAALAGATEERDGLHAALANAEADARTRAAERDAAQAELARALESGPAAPVRVRADPPGLGRVAPLPEDDDDDEEDDDRPAGVVRAPAARAHPGEAPTAVQGRGEPATRVQAATDPAGSSATAMRAIGVTVGLVIFTLLVVAVTLLLV